MRRFTKISLSTLNRLFFDFSQKNDYNCRVDSHFHVYSFSSVTTKIFIKRRNLAFEKLRNLQGTMRLQPLECV